MSVLVSFCVLCIIIINQEPTFLGKFLYLELNTADSDFRGSGFLCTTLIYSWIYACGMFKSRETCMCTCVVFIITKQAVCDITLRIVCAFLVSWKKHLIIMPNFIQMVCAVWSNCSLLAFWQHKTSYYFQWGILTGPLKGFFTVWHDW